MTYYEILGVLSNATPEDIKRAYQSKAQQYHPDRDSGDEEQFKLIKEAYEILSDVLRRSNYDRHGKDIKVSDMDITEKARMELCNIFLSILDRQDVESDILKTIKSLMTDNISNVTKMKKQVEGKIKKFNKASKRIKKKNGSDNILLTVIHNKISTLTDELINMEINVRICKRVIELSDDYEYDTSNEINNLLQTARLSLSQFG